MAVRSSLLVLIAALLGACATAPTSTRPAPEPSGSTASGTAAGDKASGKTGANSRGDASDAPPAKAAPPASAPASWHRLDLERDGVHGTGVDRALAELLADRRPVRRVVVAVIDGGVDTLHPQLAPVLWRNEREVAGNGLDDDGNGFVDDLRGWSMIPALPGDTGRYDTMELTRLYAACRGLPAGRGIPRPSGAECTDLARSYARKAAEGSQLATQVTAISGMLANTTGHLRRAMDRSTLTLEQVRSFQPATRADSNARTMWLRLATAGIDSAALAQAADEIKGSRWQLDTLFDPRSVAHDPAGSPDVKGPDASHGTHVAGIIGAVAAGGSDVRGLAPMVAIMALRAVPDGDERDAEVARAIRYAADNGAQVINMSFGKGYSPGKALVDSAVRYASQKGVLLVHAAGNDGADNDDVPSFPSRRLDGGDEAKTWIEVGASSWKGGAELPAEFSNHGARTVDLFAPGVDINSTVPGGGAEENSGTSMAAPVVSGVAALLLSYFPSLTPEQVRRIIVETARPLRDLTVTQPGSETQVPFGKLSRTGGVIDAYAAVKRAIELSRPLP